MSLNKNLYKYAFRCSSENKLVYSWSELSPQVCPNNTNHLIDLNTINIIDSVIQNSVNIIQSTSNTNNNYRAESKKLTIPPNSTIRKDYSWKYPIAIMTINWYADTTHVGDVINSYIASNTTIGIITDNINEGDTLIHVSPSVMNYINVGYEVNITNGQNNLIMDEIIDIDKINNTLLFEKKADFTMNSPAYLQMTIHNIKNIYLTPGNISLATKNIGASSLPKDVKATFEYTNNSNIEKTFIFHVELVY